MMLAGFQMHLLLLILLTYAVEETCWLVFFNLNDIPLIEMLCSCVTLMLRVAYLKVICDIF